MKSGSGQQQHQHHMCGDCRQQQLHIACVRGLSATAVAHCMCVGTVGNSSYTLHVFGDCRQQQLHIACVWDTVRLES